MPLATRSNPTGSGRRPPPASRTSSATTTTTTSISDASAPSSPRSARSSAASRLTAPTIASAARKAPGTRNVPVGGTSTPKASGRSTPLASKIRPNAPTTTSIQRIASKLHLPKFSDVGMMARNDKEPIKAYLRIRPVPEDSNKEHSEPYIDVISDCEVMMNPPTESGPTRARTHSKQPPTKYTFAKVFGPEQSSQDSQAPFFQETTLPLVNELLQGESGLIFTYGVTNSGKSYTIQGGDNSKEAGILPRALDVVFNSIEGLSSTSDIWPVGLYGVERAPPQASTAAHQPHSIDPWSVPSLSRRLAAEASKASFTPSAYQRDPTTLKVDRNHRYSVWISYVEVYNEKLFDLLDVGGTTDTKQSSGSSRLSTAGGGGMTRSDSIRGSNWSIAGMASSGTLQDLASGNGPIALTRKHLTLKTDPEGGGKYVAGLKEIRVKDIDEARELLKKGQDNRVVFGTMANRASSRSHGVFTIKIVREHAGADPDESLACTVSRLSIVDLAGSERISNTSTSGERRKEAGNINKSLMCLGQCLDTLRKNQARAAALIPQSTPVYSASGAVEEGSNTPSSKSKRRPSVVPFRHSKLTELFQPFFTGEGRTVMIVNANPYDTGFDENSHVMKFSAVAKEVQIVRTGDAPNRERRLASKALPFPTTTTTGSDGQSDVGTPPGTPRGKYRSAPATVGGSTLSVKRFQPSATKSSKPPPLSRRETEQQQQEITIIEESDEDDDSDSEEGNESDPFVDLLMERHEDLRQKLYESELRAMRIESEIREEMALEMSKKLSEMEHKYTQRLLNDAESNEVFFNQKIDLLMKANQQQRQRDRDEFTTPKTNRTKPSRFRTPMNFPTGQIQEAEEEETEVEESLQTANDTASDSSTLSLKAGPAEGKSSRRSMLAEQEEEEEEETEEENESADLTTQTAVSFDEDESAEEDEDADSENEEDASNVVGDVSRSDMSNISADASRMTIDTEDGDGESDKEDEEDEKESDGEVDESMASESEQEEESMSIEDYEPSDNDSEEEVKTSRRRTTSSRSQPSTNTSANKRRNTTTETNAQKALTPSSSFNIQTISDDEDEDMIVPSKKVVGDDSVKLSPKKRILNKKSIGRVVDAEEIERRVERY